MVLEPLDGVRRKHSICQRLLPARSPFEDAFSIASAAGFSGVEMTATSDPAAEEAVLAAVRSTGVSVSSVVCTRPDGSAYLDRDGEELEANVGVALTALRNAAAWGARTVLVTPGRVDSGMSPEASWRRSAEVVATRLLPVAKELGVVIGIENTWRSFLLTAGELLRYLDEQGSSSVGAYLDVGNVFFGHPEHWVTALAGRIVGVHYKDFTLQSNGHRGRYRFAMAGSGDVDWTRVDLALAGAGYDQWLTHAGVPRSLPVRLTARIDRMLSDRSGLAARVAKGALEGPRVRSHVRQVAELGRRGRERDRALAEARGFSSPLE